MIEKIVISGIEFFYRVNSGDWDVLDEVVVGNPYEIQDIHMLPECNIIDIGAHIGAFSKLVLKRWPKARLWAYEANPRNWELLDENLKGYSNVQIFKGACVGKKPKNKYLRMSAEYADIVTGGWGINWGPTVTSSATDVFEPIDNFFNIHDVIKTVNQIDLLKIDCEGSEFNIIHYMSVEDLKKIKYVVGEFHPGIFQHLDLPYTDIREKFLSVFDCPALEARPTAQKEELYNIFAKRR